MLDVIGNIVSDVIGDFFTRRVGHWWRNRRADRRVSQDGVECGLRLVSGAYLGISNRWRHGHAILEAGEIRFRGNAVRVLSVSTDHARRPAGREIWWVDSDCQIVEVKTADATLEWALLDRHVTWATERVRSSPDAIPG